MNLNPVFVNEIRQSVFRRKPLLAIVLWVGIAAFLRWMAQYVSAGPYPLSWLPAVVLPLVAPAFTAGAFAKEYEQQTWQDLYLTRLSNAQVVLGKFGASVLLVWLVVLSFFPATMLLMFREGNAWAVQPGWWVVVLAFKLFLSASLYVLLALVCSRYSRNRRTAMVWSYIALFLYAMLGSMVWAMVGYDVSRAGAYQNFQAGGYPAVSQDPISPSFMEGVHLIFCGVVGIGSFILLWVSLSEQRGYKDDGSSKQAWQPQKIERVNG